MAISSMTGFARASGSLGGDSWSWEIRSVNSRGLDLRCRLQGGMDRLEAFVRTAATNRFYRGNLTMNLTFSSPRKNLEIRVNQDVLNTVLEISNDLAQRIKARPPSVEGLLALRGVVDSVEAEDSEDHRKALETSILATLEEALHQFDSTQAEALYVQRHVAPMIQRVYGVVLQTDIESYYQYRRS